MLAAVRCLHDGGYAVTGTATTRLAPGLWSRYCSRRMLLPDPRTDVEAFVAPLARLLQASRHEVLIPGTDASLYAVSKHRERLTPLVRLGLPDHDAVELALDKSAVAEHAERAGLAPPEALVCASREQALEAARSFGFPVLVKPVRTVEERDAGLRRLSTVLAGDAHALELAHRRLGTSIVQRRLAGSVVGVGGVATSDGVLGAVYSRYARIWPPEAGSASFSETVSPPPALMAGTDALVRSLGWRGLFQLELIEDLDGTLHAIDFNPRAYGSMGLARPAGVPLASLWCASLIGDRPAPVSGRPGVRYRWEDADARHIRRLVSVGDYRAAARAAAPASGVTHAFMRASDPLPFVARGGQLLARVPDLTRQRRLRRGAGSQTAPSDAVPWQAQGEDAVAGDEQAERGLGRERSAPAQR